MTFDPETDPELAAELAVNVAVDQAKTRVVGGLLRVLLVAPAVIIGALPIAVLFKSLTIMSIGFFGGVAVAVRGTVMMVRGRRALAAARERRQLPVATVRMRT